MPRTSRTPRATRVASAACALTPSLLGLPLLVGAFLATLWLFGASPVHADALGGALGAAGSLTGAATGEPRTGDPDGDASRTEDRPADHSADRPAGRTGGALGLDRAASLGEVVPDGVSRPVAQTLGTVHQGLEQHTARGQGSERPGLLAELGGPVEEVREGARRVVGDLDRTRQDTAHNLLVPAVEAATRLPAALAPEAGSDEGAPASDDEDPERRGRDAARADAAAAAPGGHGPLFAFVPLAGHAAPSAVAAEHTEGTDDVGSSPATGHSAQLTTGSAAPSGGSAPAPAVAGYLTAAPVTAPAATAVLLAATSLHPVPSGAGADPTVSPD